MSNVLAVAMKHETKKDITGKKFAVLVDESTDLSTQKHMAIVIRYFSEKKQKICSSFAGGSY